MSTRIIDRPHSFAEHLPALNVERYAKRPIDLLESRIARLEPVVQKMTAARLAGERVQRFADVPGTNPAPTKSVSAIVAEADAANPEHAHRQMVDLAGQIFDEAERTGKRMSWDTALAEAGKQLPPPKAAEESRDNSALRENDDDDEAAMGTEARHRTERMRAEGKPAQYSEQLAAVRKQRGLPVLS